MLALRGGRLLLLTAALLECSIAGPITWQFSAQFVGQGLGLNSGDGTGSGVFTYDASTNSYSAWSIELSGFGFAPLTALLTPSTSSLDSASATAVAFHFASDQARLRLRFVGPDHLTPVPLDDSGHSVNVSASIDYFDALGQLSWVGTGTAAAEAVPEPATGQLLLLGAAGLLFGYGYRRCHSS